MMAYFDITRLVIEETDVDEQVARLKEDVCTGNERGSWLNKVEVYIEPTAAKIVIEVRLRNRQVWDSPFGDVVVYSDTFSVWFTGILDANCVVGAYAVTSENEIWKVLGGFATLLVNSSGLSLLITNRICRLIGFAPDALLEKGILDEYVTPVLPNATINVETDDAFDINYLSCMESILDPDAPRIKCKVSLTLTGTGKEKIKVVTYGIITSLSAEIPIDLIKSSLTGIFKEDLVQLPSLSLAIVANDESPDGRLAIRTIVSPTVWFNDGVAVNSSINMRDTEGITHFIAKRLEREINDNKQINMAIVDFVNSLPR